MSALSTWGMYQKMIDHVVLQRVAGTSVIRKTYQKMSDCTPWSTPWDFVCNCRICNRNFLIQLDVRDTVFDSWFDTRSLRYSLISILYSVVFQHDVLDLVFDMMCSSTLLFCNSVVLLVSLWRINAVMNLDTDRTISLAQLILHDKLDTYACTRTTRMDFVHNSSTYTLQFDGFRSFRTRFRQYLEITAHDVHIPGQHIQRRYHLMTKYSQYRLIRSAPFLDACCCCTSVCRNSRYRSRHIILWINLCTIPTISPSFFTNTQDTTVSNHTHIRCKQND